MRSAGGFELRVVHALQGVDAGGVDEVPEHGGAETICTGGDVAGDAWAVVLQEYRVRIGGEGAHGVRRRQEAGGKRQKAKGKRLS